MKGSSAITPVRIFRKGLHSHLTPDDILTGAHEVIPSPYACRAPRSYFFSRIATTHLRLGTYRLWHTASMQFE